MQITLNLEELNKEINNIEFSDTQILSGMKDMQVGIITITKTNQINMSKYFKLQKSENGYPEFLPNTQNTSFDVGTIDEASYGIEYYDIDKKDLLKIGIGIIIQKTNFGDWDIYPNPNPYINNDPSKVYQNISDINPSRDKNKQIKSRAFEYQFEGESNTTIQENMKMAYKGGYGTDNQTETQMIKVEDIMSKIMLLPPKTKIRFLSGSKKQLVSMDGYLVLNNSETISFSHVINVEENGKPIGYDVDLIDNSTLLNNELKNTSKNIISEYKNRLA